MMTFDDVHDFVLAAQTNRRYPLRKVVLRHCHPPLKLKGFILWVHSSRHTLYIAKDGRHWLRMRFVGDGSVEINDADDFGSDSNQPRYSFQLTDHIDAIEKTNLVHKSIVELLVRLHEVSL